MSRREFIMLGATATGAVLLGSCAGSQPETEIRRGGALRQPEVLEPVGGPNEPRTLDLVMRVEETQLALPQVPNKPPGPWTVRTFGYRRAGQGRGYAFGIPGPTLRFRRGDRFRMLLKNRLPREESIMCDPGSEPFDQFPNCFHGDNETNFHFHGSHISPNPGNDFVLLSLPPGRDERYDFVWPDNQAPGTHWYHPHKHGSTALQVGNGMAGVIIIDGDFTAENAPQIAAAKDVVMVIQELTEKLEFSAGFTQRQDLTVNGQLEPRLTMRVNEVQRWRLVGATMRTSAHVHVAFEGGGDVPKMYEIAHDGVQFAPENWRPSNAVSVVELAPGNRVDVLVKAPLQPGEYRLSAQPVTAIDPNAESEDEERKDRLLTVDVVPDDGSGYETRLPDNLPALPFFLRDVEDVEIVRRRQLTFAQIGKQEGGRGGKPPQQTPPQFAIDGRKFDPERVDQVMVKGTAEEWTIYNTSRIRHPFHIHINPFQVVATSSGGELQRPWIWQDTIALPTGTEQDPGWVRIRHRFTDYTGTFVLHCHILGHEDRGMMQLLQVAESPEPILIPPVAFCSIPAGTTPVLAAGPGEPVTS